MHQTLVGRLQLPSLMLSSAVPPCFSGFLVPEQAAVHQNQSHLLTHLSVLLAVWADAKAVNRQWHTGCSPGDAAAPAVQQDHPIPAGSAAEVAKPHSNEHGQARDCLHIQGQQAL